MHFQEGNVYFVQCRLENHAYERALVTFVLARQQSTLVLFSQKSSDQIDELTDLLPNFTGLPYDALTVSTFSGHDHESWNQIEHICSESDASLILIGDSEDLSEIDRLNLKNIASSNRKPIVVFQPMPDREVSLYSPLAMDHAVDGIELLRSGIKCTPSFIEKQQALDRNAELHILRFELWIEMVVCPLFPEIVSLRNWLDLHSRDPQAPILIPRLAELQSEAEIADLIAVREPGPFTFLLTANYLRIRRSKSPNRLDHKVLNVLTKTVRELKLDPCCSHLIVDAIYFPSIPVSAQLRSTTQWCKLMRHVKRRVNASAAAEMLLLNLPIFSNKRAIASVNHLLRIKRADYSDPKRLFQAIENGPAYDIPREQSSALLIDLFSRIDSINYVDTDVLYECMCLLDEDYRKLDELDLQT